jgi:GNAT superfamily N-acetyltransferase
VVEAGARFDAWPDVLRLILDAFASMDGVIDPPSSAHRLTPQALAEKAGTETCLLAVDGDRLVGCCFARREPDGLYLGKLAVHQDARGRGVGRLLLSAVEERARALGLTRLRLETRVELVANHATFEAWGFVRTAVNSHEGYTRPTSVEMTKHLPV